jgi:CRP/FNR family transcriptional regulator
MESSLAIAQAKYWHLKQVALFAQLAAPEVRQIGEHFDTALVEAGERIYQFGDLADRVYILKSGRIKVTRASSAGKEFILYFISPGEIFGELAITGKELRTGTATVLEDAFICAIDREHFEAFMLRHPEVSLNVSRVIGQRKDRTERRVLDLISKDVRTRLANTLAELATDYGTDEKRGVRIDLRLTQSDLAQLVGSTRETTSTVFNEFRRAGLVDAEGRTVWVLDPEALGGYALTPRVRRPSRAA